MYLRSLELELKQLLRAVQVFEFLGGLRGRLRWLLLHDTSLRPRVKHLLVRLNLGLLEGKLRVESMLIDFSLLSCIIE